MLFDERSSGVEFSLGLRLAFETTCYRFVGSFSRNKTDSSVELEKGVFYSPENGVPDPDLNQDLGPESIKTLLLSLGKDIIAEHLVDVDGIAVLTRFLEARGSHIPAETYIMKMVIRNGLAYLHVKMEHRFALRSDLAMWFDEKGPVRCKGIWVLLPGPKSIDKVVEITSEKALLASGLEIEPETARPFLTWEQLPTGLRKKTLSTKAITPNETLRKVDTFVEYVFSNAAHRSQTAESNSFWKPRNLVFGGGTTGNYLNEMFWGGKPFYIGREKPASLGLLLPVDFEQEDSALLMPGLLEASKPKMAQLGLPFELVQTFKYNPDQPDSLPGAIEEILKVEMDMLVGVVAPKPIDPDLDPYFYTKRKLTDAGLPSQMIKLSTLRKFRDRYNIDAEMRQDIWRDEIYQGFWVNCALKLGSVPWIIRDSGLAPSVLVGMVISDENAGMVVLDHHMRFIAYQHLSGKITKAKIKKTLARWEDEDIVFHLDDTSLHLSKILSELGDVVHIKPSDVQVAPEHRRTKMLAGVYLRIESEPEVFHVATESWAPYREYNLYRVAKVSGKNPARKLAESAFWAGRGYLSSFPMGPSPATLHFARGVINAVAYGFMQPDSSGNLPMFL